MKTILLCLFFMTNTYALKLANVDIAPTKTVHNKELVLNGAGIRKATWLKVKVYVGSLYLTEKSTDIKKILSIPAPKYLKMHFVRSVDKNKLNDGWQEAFSRSLSKEELKQYQKSIDTFKNSIQDMEKNDSIELTFFDDRLEYKVKNIMQKPIVQKGFAEKLLSVWFINAEDEGLKKGLQGL